MRGNRYRLSRNVAVLGAIVGTAVLVLGLARMLDGGAAREAGGLAFLALWCAAWVAIVGTILWAAFSSGASSTALSRAPDDDGPPR